MSADVPDICGTGLTASDTQAQSFFDLSVPTAAAEPPIPPLHKVAAATCCTPHTLSHGPAETQGIDSLQSLLSQDTVCE